MTNIEYYNIVSYLKGLVKGTEFENKLYTVGGCNRDILLERDIKDIDLVVAVENGGLKFAEFLSDQGVLIRDPVCYPSYGTSMFTLTAFPNVELEAVQTRSEAYADRSSRNPTATAFGTIEEDCMRRDLTINALYYDVSLGVMRDFSGKGFDDMKNKVIRTPCDPNETYMDDPLRILRCVRFAARLGWKVEDETYSALKANVSQLERVSAERIRDEFDKIRTDRTQNMHDGLRMLDDIGAVPYIFPSLRKFPDAVYNLEAFETADAPGLQLACMFGDPQTLQNDMRAAKYSNQEVDDAKKLLRSAIGWVKLWNPYRNGEVETVPYADIRRFLHGSRLTMKQVRSVFKLLEAKHVPVEYYENYADLVRREDWEFLHYTLPLSGNDVVDAGFTGARCGQALRLLYEYAYSHDKFYDDDLRSYLKSLR